MDSDSPFASITELCRISSSQVDQLRRCLSPLGSEDDATGDEDYYSGDIPIASTEITMISLPETPTDNENDDFVPLASQNDVFQTPHKGSSALASSQSQQQTPNTPLAHLNEEDRTLDIARDSQETVVVDLGLETEQEVSGEVAGAHDKEVIHCEYMKSGSPFKTMKFRNAINYGFLTPKPNWSLVERKVMLDRLVNTLGNVKSKSRKFDSHDRILALGTSREGIVSVDCSIQSPLKFQNEDVYMVRDSGGQEHSGESVGRRKLVFPTEVLGTVFHKNDGVLRDGKIGDGGEGTELCNSREGPSKRRSINGIDKFRYAGSSGSKSRCAKDSEVEESTRFLPMSICESEDSEGGEEMLCDDVLPPENCKDILLMALKLLPKDDKHEPSLLNLNILEAAKRCGVTFP